MRLSFDTFSKAVDVAMVRTSVEVGSRVGGARRETQRHRDTERHRDRETEAQRLTETSTTGARPGELYCRKMVAHWRRARGGDPDCFPAGDSTLIAHAGEVGGATERDRDRDRERESFADMLELLVPLSVRDASEVLEEEFL